MAGVWPSTCAAVPSRRAPRSTPGWPATARGSAGPTRRGRSREGPAALVDRVDPVVKELSDNLAAAPNRPVRISFWGPWSLTLDDMLIARTMELVVHSDDLAVSVGIATPEFPSSAFNTVIDLLS